MVVEVVTSQVLLVYASQTGNAQAIAESLCHQLGEVGITLPVKCCSEVESTALLQVSCLVVVASTTGDGDPPDSACKLWKQLRKWSGSPLSHLSYTVLGLGDTNYTNFCNFGKNVDKQLKRLGAQSFYRCGWADDGTGLEVVVEPWCEGLQVALKLHPSSLSMQGSTPPDTTSSPPCLDITGTNNRSDGGDGSESVSRTAANNEEPNCNETHQSSVYENNRELEMAVSSANEDVVSQIIAHHNIDLLPQHEMEHLPLRGCTLSKDASLSIPVLPPSYLTLTLTQDCEAPTVTTSTGTLPAAASQVVKTSVAQIRQLTHPTAVKTTLEFTLKLPEEGFNYHPGDSFGILVKNPHEEVELLLGLLGLKEIADRGCELSVTPGTKKRAAAVPSFLPCKSSVRHLLEYCVDFRGVPKKPLLRALAQYTTESSEQRRLLELVSKEGAGEYTRHVREACLSTLDLLLFFRSCRPPVTTLLEHLPRLLPRPYSAASSPLVTPNHVTFVFNVIHIPQGSNVAFSRKGVCTGWLASMASNNCENVEPTRIGSDINDVDEALNNLTLASYEDTHIDIYLRNNQSFRPPLDSSLPVVMVGPGTGVAPFLGFLKHRQKTGVGEGSWWLFYGCRHKDKDFLYQKELRKLEEEGVLNHLIVSYSREADGPKYVQDNIVKYGATLAPLLDKAIVYVCGDARNMAKDVFEAFVSILRKYNELSEADARKVVTKMQLDRRYLQDVWT